jgi:hypothetical protein
MTNIFTWSPYATHKILLYKYLTFSPLVYYGTPVTVAERSKEYIVFARSEAGIVGSNPKQGMDVWWCMCLFCVCVVLCLGRGFATSWSLVQGVRTSVNDHETEKQRPGPAGVVETVKKEYCGTYAQNFTQLLYRPRRRKFFAHKVNMLHRLTFETGVIF